MTREFLDTNILVYAFSEDARAERARSLLHSGGATGIQCLNEFVNVALNKLKMDWTAVGEALAAIQLLCAIAAPVDLQLHRKGLVLAKRYRLRIFDALIVAAAIDARCSTLWSEDMQDGLVIEGVLTIRNPFVSA
jgi:predicted nucleic acid-binding protein